MSACLAEPLGASARSRARLADIVTFSCVDGPGNRFVVFLQGCNFDCIACHNPHTIPLSNHRLVDVDDVIGRLRRAAPFLSGITVSGGEATLQADFVRELFAAVKTEAGLARLTCFVDSNGATELATWDELVPVMDAAMIDLKCLDPEIHARLTGNDNAQVLASIRHLHALGKLHEVRLLLLAGWNDDIDLVRRTGEWLADVDPQMRLKVIGFRCHGTRPHDPPLEEPSADHLHAAASILRTIAPFDVAVV